MTHSTTDLSEFAIKFNQKNQTNYETSWLLCGKCNYWLTSPIFMHQDEKHYCAKCSTELGGGLRIKALETLLLKCQYPCINEECPSWFSFENIQKHKGVCKFNVFPCNFCAHQCTEKDYLDHLIASHSEVCNNVKITNSLLQIEFKNNSESKEKIIIGDYDSGIVVIYAKIEKEQVYIGLASAQFDDTMKTKIGYQYKMEDRCDGISGKTRLGKFMSLQQFGNLTLYDVVPLSQDWKFVGINITLQNLGNLLKIAECPICMYPMKESIVLCENGHPVCNRCAPRMEKCAVCRMTMSKVTMRLSDVIQNVECGILSKLAENRKEAQSLAIDNNSMRKCPECGVEVMMNAIVVHFIEYHGAGLRRNNFDISKEVPAGNKGTFYIIFDEQIFQITLILSGEYGAISVCILSSNDSIVAKRYNYEFKAVTIPVRSMSNGISILKGPCQNEPEPFKPLYLDAAYRSYKFIVVKV